MPSSAHSPHLGPGAAVTPEVADWRHLSFHTADLDDRPLQVGEPDREVALVTLSGGVVVRVRDNGPIERPGRASVWDGLPWALYLPAGVSASAVAIGERSVVAIASAKGNSSS